MQLAPVDAQRRGECIESHHEHGDERDDAHSPRVGGPFEWKPVHEESHVDAVVRHGLFERDATKCELEPLPVRCERGECHAKHHGERKDDRHQCAPGYLFPDLDVAKPPRQHE
jgi:hypothetical protein